ncbi:MAG: pantoate--beta-alanine ligase [Actinomycetota bacterium]|nr:pantoate--beta-alanine ligase [Actinomycetota bacterium]
MRIARTIADVRAALAARPLGASVGFVPTMGALHLGHASLLAAARKENNVAVASVFVNPAQFGPGEDFERYPRDEEADVRALAEAGTDVAFFPDVQEMYPPGFKTWVDVAEVSRGLEGDARPGHFRGVATVCLKLFHIVEPDRVYFGQKDAQQVEVIGRMLVDLDLDLEVELRVLPTVRDEDGVAMSSRNARLSTEEREAARALPRALFAGADAYRYGGHPVPVARTVLLGERRLEPEYVEVASWNGKLVLAAAVRAGATRLIDNVVLEESRA